jgi:hypothetical protein
MPENKLMIVGDSHVTSLINARHDVLHDKSSTNKHVLDISVFGSDSGLIAREFTLDIKGKGIVLNPIIKKVFHEIVNIYNRYSDKRTIDGNHELILIFGFSEVHVIGLHFIWNHYTINGIFPISRDDKRYRLFPKMVKESLDELLSPFWAGLRILKDMGYKLTILASPPPTYEDYVISTHFPHHKLLPEPGIRKFIFESMSDIIGSKCQDIGISYLNYSHMFSNHDGFLQNKFVYDGIHANSAYGLEILKIIHKRFLG